MDSLGPILVLQTAFLGDVILTLLFLRKLRKLRPKSRIILVVRKGLGNLIRELNLVDEIYEIQKGDSTSYSKLKKIFSSYSFEWIFCPHPSVRSAVFVSGLRSGRKISFSNWWNFFFFTDRIKKAAGPEPLRVLDLLSALDADFRAEMKELLEFNWCNLSPSGKLPEVPERIGINMKQRLGSTRVGVQTWALFPGSVWATKQWPKEYFAEIAEKLLAEGRNVVWMGGPEEKELALELLNRVPKSRSLAGSLSLLESCQYLAGCEGVISNDSGGQHMAALSGSPVLTLFGPTRPDMGFRAWAQKAFVAEIELPCRPCGPHGSAKCPRGTHQCMRELSPNLVWSRVEKMLGPFKEKPSF